MTFSIAARCPRSGEFGVAAATAMLAVGKLVTHAEAGVGAVATQATLNPYLGIDGLALLRDGLSATQTMERLRQSDPRAQVRQFGVVDRRGRTAAWSGEECPTWAGSEQRENYTAQGNRLVGRQVIDAVVDAMENTKQQPLADRFLSALAAGVAAGGDTKGEASASIYIMSTEEYPLWDIRVDQHDEPIEELRRLHGLFGEQLLPQIKKMPTRANPAGEAGEGNA